MCSRPGTFFWFHIWDNCDFNGQFATNSISSNVLNMPQANKYWRNYVWQSKTIGFTPFFQATGGHQLGHTAHFCLLRPWKVGQTQSPDFPFPAHGDGSHYPVTHISTWTSPNWPAVINDFYIHFLETLLICPRSEECLPLVQSAHFTLWCSNDSRARLHYQPQLSGCNLFLRRVGINLFSVWRPRSHSAQATLIWDGVKAGDSSGRQAGNDALSHVAPCE